MCIHIHSIELERPVQLKKLECLVKEFWLSAWSHSCACISCVFSAIYTYIIQHPNPEPGSSSHLCLRGAWYWCHNLWQIYNNTEGGSTSRGNWSMRQGCSWVDGRNNKDQPCISLHFQKMFSPHTVVNWTVDKPGCLPAQQEGRVLPPSQTAKENLQLSLTPGPANDMNWTLPPFYTLEMCLQPGKARVSHRLSTRGIHSLQQSQETGRERCKAVKPLDKSYCKGIWQVPLLHLAPDQKTKPC